MMLPSGVLSEKYESAIAIFRTRTQWLLLAAVVILLFCVPLFATDYWVRLLTGLATTIVALFGLHILTGLCGQFSIGHAAFMGVGAYTVAILTNSLGWNGWVCLPLSGIAAGMVGLFFGLPSYRLKGFYLAISTLAASFIIAWCINYDKFEDWTGGFGGLVLERLKLGGIDFNDREALYLVAISIMLLATFLTANIQRTRAGRNFLAIRDNERAAEVSGINVFRYKLLAFFIGCFFAGIAGWLWAYSMRNVNADQFNLELSIWMVGMLIIGGMGSIAGVFFGAAAFRLLQHIIDISTPHVADIVPQSMEPQIHVVMSLGVYSIILLAFLILEPRGLSHQWEKFKLYYRLYPYANKRE
jgi:branched-chain amino acid transport system permease protein